MKKDSGDSCEDRKEIVEMARQYCDKLFKWKTQILKRGKKSNSLGMKRVSMNAPFVVFTTS